MNLLVTGGAGFIGSHFVLRHAESASKDRVVVLDALSHGGNEEFLASAREKIVFQKGDITDVTLVSKLIAENEVDTIVNFAAETHVDRSIKNPVPFLHSNVVGVQSLIEVCRLHMGLRLLHISTDEVYGDIKDGDRPREVGDVLAPSSPYAASKAAGEMLLIAAMRTWQLPIAITRCTNNYGPHQAEEKFVPTVILGALKSNPIPVYAKGENRRDWLYVSDHIDALDILLKTPWAFRDEKIRSGHIFNISADDERRNIDVAKEILRILKKPESLLTFVEDRPGHDWRYALDSSPLCKLGWRPKVKFEEGIKRTIEWFKART
jgi:dTDP-glucose 4,6-dehydratase